jgi:tripartite-type tricarboxylate transporter receptor subunit TctC
VLAQSDKGPIRMLVGFPAGGTIDVVARILADHLKDELGATVIIESKPGAGGLIAAQALKAAPADGRTMLLSPDHTIVMSPLTMKTPGFQPLTDFAPVAQVARYAGAFAVTSGVEARNLDQYFAWAKAGKGRGNVGIPAPGSIPQFFVHLLEQQTQAALVSVPYRGSAPMLQDLMGGQISAGTTALGDFVEAHEAGKVRVIAVLGDKRSAAMPDVPTFTEQGYKIA